MSQRVFEITVGGEMDAALCAAFDDVELTVGHGVTRLRATCRDAAALHGVLGRIESLGLELLAARPIDATSP